MENESLRTFIAIDMPAESRRALRALQDGLKKGSRAPVKWVDPDSIHLTLKFLGSTQAGMVPRILDIMAGAVRGVKPFPVELKGLGAFPNLNRVRVVWVGLSGEIETLAQVQDSLEAGLEPLGFRSEERAFSPHFTLGRVREQASPDERRRLGELISATTFEAGGRFTVEALHLVKSQLTREGPIYSRLGTVDLAKF